MPDNITVRSDGVLEMFVNNANNAPAWMPRTLEMVMRPLGEKIVTNMRAAVEENRYTKALEDSITSEYDVEGMRLEISPKELRGGKWDAGLLLELGTRPIPNLPWAPIKAWADFRGIPAFPVWFKIREQGVSPHPFLDRTLEASMPDIDNTAQELVDAMAVRIVGSGGYAQPAPMG